MRNRAERRHLNIKKALRKKKISDNYIGNIPYYNNLHQYSKNKIHCSCPLCCAKSNIRPSITDIKKNEALDYSIKSYLIK